MGRQGFEPWTYGLKIHSSNLLSYRPEGRDLYSIAGLGFNQGGALQRRVSRAACASSAQLRHTTTKQTLQSRQHLFARLDSKFVDRQMSYCTIRQVQQELYGTTTRVLEQ